MANTDEIKNQLDSRYESYILIGQEVEFEETDLFIKAYSMGIYSLLESAFKQYPVLKEIAKDILESEV